MAREQHNPAVGRCVCPICTYPNSTVHRTRKGTRGLLYLFCAHCGCLQPTGIRAQFVLSRATRPLDDVRPEPALPEIPTTFELAYHRRQTVPLAFEQAPAPARAPDPEPAEKRGGSFIDDLAEMFR